MGAFLSRMWSEIAHYMGWGLIPTGYGVCNPTDGDIGSSKMDTDESVVIPTKDSEDTNVRRRVTKTPEKGKRSKGQSSPKIQSASPTKSDWDVGADHPKPNLEVVPPNKKTKTEEEREEKDGSVTEKMQFETIANTQFGTEECPDSLSPDFLMTSMPGTLDRMNGHHDDTSPHSLLSKENTEEPMAEQSEVVMTQHYKEPMTQQYEEPMTQQSDIPTVQGVSGDVQEVEKDRGDGVMGEIRGVGSLNDAEEEIRDEMREEKRESECEVDMACGDGMRVGEVDSGAQKDEKSENHDVVMMHEETEGADSEDSGTSDTNGKDSCKNIPKIVINTEYMMSDEVEQIGKDSSAENQEVESNVEDSSEDTNISCSQSDVNNSDTEREISERDSENDTHEKRLKNSTNEKRVVSGNEFEKNEGKMDGFNIENMENFDPNIQPKGRKNVPSRPVSVQWTGEAKEVYITGSWLDWKGQVQLHKSDENIWLADLELEENVEEIELKFIVDGDWVISHDMPSVDDGAGNRNNYIRLLRHG